MNFYTSDWHIGDDRIGINGKPNLFYRPFDSLEEQHEAIFAGLKKCMKNGDTLYHLGDVMVDDSFEPFLAKIRDYFSKSTFYLIAGNYDEDKTELLSRYFEIFSEHEGVTEQEVRFYMNHYPVKCLEFLSSNPHIPFALTGHIHGLWKVQPQLINVGVDAWHFRPVSEDQICFCWNAIHKVYDQHVFPMRVKI